MAVLRLAPGSTARVTPGPMTLHWQVSGAAQPDVALSVERSDAPGQRAPAAQPQGPETWLLAAVPVAASVVVRPAHGGTFPDGVQVDVQLALGHGGSVGDQYVLPSTDVSGTAQVTLLRLAPADGSVDLVLPSGADPVPPETGGVGRRRRTTDPSSASPVPALTQSAIYRARELAGPEGRVAEADRVELHVGVDRSASMLPLVRDGVRQALLEVLAGLNEVVGTSADAPVWQLGTVPEPVRPGLSAAGAETYDQLLGSTAHTTGTVLAPLIAATSSSRAPRTVVVVTDGVPADLEELAAAIAQAEQAGSRTRWHLLAVARSTSDAGVRSEPWRDELSPLAPLLGPSLTLSSVTPGHGPGWLAQRLAQPEELADLLVQLQMLGGSR